MEVYVGSQPEGPYKVSNSSSDIVKRFMNPLFKSGQNLTIDNWYTSYDLAKDLLSEKIIIIGTMRKNKEANTRLNLEYVKEEKHILLSSDFSKMPH